MARRAANNRGSIRQRTDGRWEARLSYVDPNSGERKRASVYASTQKGLLAEMDKMQDRLDQGKPPKDATATVSSWLKHWRETTLAASDRKAATQELYANLSRKHLEAEPFGAIRLDRLKPSDIERLILNWRRQTRGGKATEVDPTPKPVRAMSDSTIRSSYAVLRQALDGAVRDGLLARNPAALVKRPGVERQEVSHLTADEVVKLLRAAEGSRYHPALVLISHTALRRGEALALRWTDVDLSAGVLSVRGTLGRINGKLHITAPKTDRSRRTLPLSSAIVSMLRKHKVAQASERLRARNIWQENNLVFCTEDGNFCEPRNLLRTVQAAATKAGLKGVVVHELRHAAATSWLEGGVHIRAVADLLGHSSVAITGDTYSFTADNAARAAMDGLSARLNC